MRIFELESLSFFLRRFLQMTFAVGVFVTIFLSFILWRFFGYYFVDSPRYYYACLFILTPCGALALLILWQLISILKTIDQKNPFVEKNVKHFFIIGWCSMVISLLVFILGVYYPTMFTFIVSYIFLVCGLAAFVFGQLFKKAVVYKNENDLTI